MSGKANAKKLKAKLKTRRHAAFIQLSYGIVSAQGAYMALILRIAGRFEGRAGEFAAEGGMSFE